MKKYKQKLQEYKFQFTGPKGELLYLLKSGSNKVRIVVLSPPGKGIELGRSDIVDLIESLKEFL